MLKDMKEALSSTRKADTTHVRKAFQDYVARPCEYGSEKYQRANFLRFVPDGVPHSEPNASDFERFRAYLRAARGHIDDVLESMERHQAGDPGLTDVPGMKTAAFAIDTDTKPGQALGASLLPHVAPACASLMMAVTQATDCGLLPKDPGQPWKLEKALAELEAPDVRETVKIEGCTCPPKNPGSTTRSWEPGCPTHGKGLFPTRRKMPL